MHKQEPVQDDEFVYRRIHHHFFDPRVPVLVRREAFRPNHNDDTGLSVFRAGLVTPLGTLATIDLSKKDEYYVARLSVRDLRQLGLTVVPDPDPTGPPGHAIIPELRWQAYQADKQRLKSILVELARLASLAIVHQPS